MIIQHHGLADDPCFTSYVRDGSYAFLHFRAEVFALEMNLFPSMKYLHLYSRPTVTPILALVFTGSSECPSSTKSLFEVMRSSPLRLPSILRAFVSFPGPLASSSISPTPLFLFISSTPSLGSIARIR